MHDRDGEHSAVVCMLEYNRPPAASASRFGVAIGLPKQPSCPYPTSSSTMNSTFGEPASARSGRGHAGLDSSVVRPITPGNAVPGSYSFSGIVQISYRWNGRSWPLQEPESESLTTGHCHRPPIAADHPSRVISRCDQPALGLLSLVMRREITRREVPRDQEEHHARGMH